jgi:hypothetical protein
LICLKAAVAVPDDSRRFRRQGDGMTITDQTATDALPQSRDPGWTARSFGLLIAIAVLAVVLALPTPTGLPVAGHRTLAILAFAVIVWMTEAVDYAVSAIIVAALMASCSASRPARRIRMP